MGLGWVRLDVNIASHDKFTKLLSDPSSKKWQAAFSYTCALGYAGGHGTDGVIPISALPFVHGTSATARLLVKYGLWREETAAYRIVNYEHRQELNVVAEAKRAAQVASARKTNCERHHGKQCGCWREAS